MFSVFDHLLPFYAPSESRSHYRSVPPPIVPIVVRDSGGARRWSPARGAPPSSGIPHDLACFLSATSSPSSLSSVADRGFLSSTGSSANTGLDCADNLDYCCWWLSDLWSGVQNNRSDVRSELGDLAPWSTWFGGLLADVLELWKGIVGVI